MDQRLRALRIGLTAFALVFFSACTGGIKAGGEEPTNNGGIAFVAFTVMLILTGVVLWLILGRRD